MYAPRFSTLEHALTCPSCGTENPTGKRFCGGCGAPLGTVCPNCGGTVPAGQRFCGDCGTRLAAAAAADQGVDAAPVAERRLVSILFADLVGFTTISEAQDAEETRNLLTGYFDVARGVIGRYGGSVEKFIGDAVMAVWGAPSAHEDDAERAVRAALELVDAVTRLGPGIQARAGILTGEAVVTLGAIGQGMVAGDVVNTASRLQSAAAPGTVLVGEATERAASRAIAFEPAGAQTLKGKAAPVAAWRAIRVVAERGGRNRADTLEAPFVGRDDELRLVKDLFQATVRERRARLVSVIGPAGIGKTRLSREFLHYLDGVVETVRYHEGRSPAYGEGISFWALGEMVRRRAGLLETDDEATTRTRIAETLADHVPDEAERRWIEPALLTLLGIEADVGSEQLFGAWRTFFERMAAAHPVVMVFEDHHLADSGLLDFVDHLLEWSRDVPIYVVTLSRPELLERRPDAGGARRSFASVHLDPLPRPAMETLLAGLVPGLPETAIRAIVDRADGIPLYAVETVRMLLADGRLVLEDGAYRPVGDLTGHATPPTLTALIASRLDSLEPADRSLVSDAAVLGQSFAPAGLAAVAGLGEAELEPHLRTLVRRELLTLQVDPRSPERGQYGFVQALIRETAYNTLAKPDRKRRHLAAARYFEGLGADELAGGLAGHYLAALANTSDTAEADALSHQARIALVAAADRATALGSLAQASAFLRQALTVATDDGERASLLERAGTAASGASRSDEAEELLRRAMAMQRERGDRAGIARATAALGAALLLGYRTEAAFALLQPAAEEFADLDGDPGFLAILGQLARACLLTSRFEQSVVIAERALPLAERSQAMSVIADVLITKGTAFGSLARIHEGIALVEAGVRMAEQHGLGATAVRGRLNHGYLVARMNPAATLDIDMAGLAEARRLGQRRYATVFATNAAAEAMLVGDFSRSVEHCEELLETDLSAEDRILVLARIALIRAWRGEDVDDDLSELRRLANALGDVNVDRYPIEVEATRAFVSGHFAEAASGYRSIAETDAGNARQHLGVAARASILAGDASGASGDLAVADATGVHGAWPDGWRASVEAGLAAIDGRPDDALAQYHVALRLFDSVGMRLDRALTGMEMAALLDPAAPDVRAAAERAREILIELEATTLLARLDATLARPAATAMRSAPVA